MGIYERENYWKLDTEQVYDAVKPCLSGLPITDDNWKKAIFQRASELIKNQAPQAEDICSSFKLRYVYHSNEMDEFAQDMELLKLVTEIQNPKTKTKRKQELSSELENKVNKKRLEAAYDSILINNEGKENLCDEYQVEKKVILLAYNELFFSKD